MFYFHLLENAKNSNDDKFCLWFDEQSLVESVGDDPTLQWNGLITPEADGEGNDFKYHDVNNKDDVKGKLTTYSKLLF